LLPAERVLAKAIASGEIPTPREGRKFAQSTDIVVALLGIALVAMIVQF
jgi:hypothetical protein